MSRQTWAQTCARYDAELYSRDKHGRYEWFLFDGNNPAAVDLGRARTRLTLHLAVWAAYVRRWRKDRRAT